MKNKSTEQLKSYSNLTKGITIAIIFMIVILIGISVYGFLMKENKSAFIALFTVGISGSAILPLLFINIKKIKTELNSREETN